MLHTVHSILEHVQYSAYYSMCDATLRCILHIIGLIARVNDSVVRLVSGGAGHAGCYLIIRVTCNFIGVQ